VATSWTAHVVKADVVLELKLCSDEMNLDDACYS